jgi:hypothetical protein
MEKKDIIILVIGILIAGIAVYYWSQKKKGKEPFDFILGNNENIEKDNETFSSVTGGVRLPGEGKRPQFLTPTTLPGEGKQPQFLTPTTLPGEGKQPGFLSNAAAINTNNIKYSSIKNKGFITTKGTASRQI